MESQGQGMGSGTGNAAMNAHLIDFDRAGRLTASQCAAALGLCKFTSRAKLWRQLTGREAPFEGNVYTQYGNDNEHHAIAALEARMGVIVDAGRFCRHPTIEWLGASPDGFLYDAIVEAKCPQTIHTECPIHYKVQIAVQMACAQMKKGYFVSWTPGDLMIEKIDFDKQWWDTYIYPGLDIFWNKYVAKDIEPPRGKFNPEKEAA
jgi:putative phage-type endonuclease